MKVMLWGAVAEALSCHPETARVWARRVGLTLAYAPGAKRSRGIFAKDLPRLVVAVNPQAPTAAEYRSSCEKEGVRTAGRVG